MLSAQPKSANPEMPANLETGIATSGDEPSAVIALADRTMKPEAAGTAVLHRSEGLVTVRPKPEKRKNAKERAKAKFAKDNTKEKTAEDGTRPMTVTAKSEVEIKAGKKATTKAKKSKAA